MENLPIWAGFLIIVAMRIGDVSLGTLRTISVVQGRLQLSVLLGFLEVLIWFTAVAQAIQGISRSMWLVFAYAVGYAAGNAVGILLDRWLAMGTVEVQCISVKSGPRIAQVLRDRGRRITTFNGEGRDGPNVMIYAILPRRDLGMFLKEIHEVDPNAVYTVHLVGKHSPQSLGPFPHSTGWRTFFQRK